MPEPEPARPPLVLVVDDEPDILDCLRELIEKSLAYRVLTVLSGPEALRVLEERRGDAPDLLIVDNHLHGMTGIEFLERVRAEHGVVPAILCTAYADAALLHLAVRRGRISMLAPKPIDPEPFLLSVEHLVVEKRAGRLAPVTDLSLHRSGADAEAGQPG